MPREGGMQNCIIWLLVMTSSYSYIDTKSDIDHIFINIYTPSISKYILALIFYNVEPFTLLKKYKYNLFCYNLYFQKVWCDGMKWGYSSVTFSKTSQSFTTYMHSLRKTSVLQRNKHKTIIQRKLYMHSSFFLNISCVRKYIRT